MPGVFTITKFTKALALTRFQEHRRPELAFAFPCACNLLKSWLTDRFKAFALKCSSYIMSTIRAAKCVWKTIPQSHVVCRMSSYVHVCPWSCLARSASWIGSYQPCHPSRAEGSEPCAKLLSFKLLDKCVSLKRCSKFMQLGSPTFIDCSITNSQDCHLGAQSFHLQLQQVEFIAHLCIQQGPEHNEWLEKARKSLETRRVDWKLFKQSSYILQLSHFIFRSRASCTSHILHLVHPSLHCSLLCRHQTTAQGWNFASASDRPRNAPESSSSSSTVYGIQTCFFKHWYSSLKNWKTLKQKVRMSHTRRDVLAVQILLKPGLYNIVQTTETTSFVWSF